MPRRRNMLNVRDLLERLTPLKETLDKYGYCPLAHDELRQMEFLARAILRKTAAKGRKDAYVERS